MLPGMYHSIRGGAGPSRIGSPRSWPGLNKASLTKLIASQTTADIQSRSGGNPTREQQEAMQKLSEQDPSFLTQCKQSTTARKRWRCSKFCRGHALKAPDDLHQLDWSWHFSLSNFRFNNTFPQEVHRYGSALWSGIVSAMRAGVARWVARNHGVSYGSWKLLGLIPFLAKSLMFWLNR